MADLETKLPPVPTTIEATGLSRGFLQDLALKHIYFIGEMLGNDIARNMHLPFTDVVEPLLRHLKDEKYVEVKGGGQVAPHHLKGLKAFREEYQTRQAIVVSLDPKPRIIDGISILPWADFLTELWGSRILK